MPLNEFDLIIAGAGPAGCTLALHLAGKGLRIGMFEKSTFPRDKICGDALSGKVLNILKRIPGGIYDDFIREVPKLASGGIRFTAPNYRSADIPFPKGTAIQGEAAGYICDRSTFDSFLFSKVTARKEISIFQGEPVLKTVVTDDCIGIMTAHGEYHAKVIAGADGVHSVVRKNLLNLAPPKKHLCTGIRAYFENVSGLHPENFIELIFLKRLLPGYFWIFPTSGGRVNAGFGMLQNRIVKERKSMISIMEEVLSTDPLISPRFRDARIIGRPEAHVLPMGTWKPARSGERFLLMGDAAFLVDPFSGEGIGNAMASGEIASEILTRCFEADDFSGNTMMKYDQRINRRFEQEFRTMSMMQRLAGSASLFNMVVNKASVNTDLRELLSSMYTSQDARKLLSRPGFYTGLLFR